MPEPLDPVSFFVSLGAGEVTASVLAWVAVAVSAAVSLVLVVAGIKKGLGFFMGLLEERGAAGWDARANQAYDDWVSAGFGAGSRDFALYLDERLAGADHETALEAVHDWNDRQDEFSVRMFRAWELSSDGGSYSDFEREVERGFLEQGMDEFEARDMATDVVGRVKRRRFEERW